MQINGVIKFFYLLYTIYILIIIDITNITLFQIFFPIIFMWLNYLIYNLGFGMKKKNNEKSIKLLSIFEKKKNLIFLTILVVLFSLSVAKYYTGKTPILIIESIRNKSSLYNEYQQYFNENDIKIFSLRKIPYVIMLFIVKLGFLSTILYFYKIKESLKKNKVQKFCLFIMILSYIYIGIARGTNFEFFELCILIIYILLSKNKKNIKKNISKILLIIIGMIILYSIRLEQRGVKFSYYITKDVYYISNNIISNLFGDIDYFLLKIYSYFGFGFFYTGKFVSDILFGTDGGLLILLFPNWYMLTSRESILNRMKDIVDIGVKWNPDLVILIEKYSYLNLLILIYFLGVISKKIYFENNSNLEQELIKFYILIFFISLPIGSFIDASSSNKLIILCLIFSRVLKKISKRRKYR